MQVLALADSDVLAVLMLTGSTSVQKLEMYVWNFCDRTPLLKYGH